MHYLKIPRSPLWAATLLLSSGLLLVLTPATAATFSTPEGVEGAPRTETTGGATREGNHCWAGEASSSEGARTPSLSDIRMDVVPGERPTFVLHVPKMTATNASFSLQDESRNPIYQTKVKLPDRGGALSIPLPNAVSALDAGKNYKWLVEIHCTPGFNPDNPIVEGWVRPQ